MKSLFKAFITTSILTAAVVSASSLIIGGTPVLENEHPAVFAINTVRPVIDEERSGEALCTGFLVQPKLILTAAHCLLDVTSIDLIANGTNIKQTKTQGTTAEATHFKPRPGYQNPKKDMPFSQLKKSASIDIGYIVLRNPIAAITPLPVFVSDSWAAIEKLLNKEVTLVGYGATQFLSSGGYENAPKDVKYKGTKQVTTITPDFLVLDGEKNGALPGDSGGPEIAEIDGKVQVIALNHSMNMARKIVKTTKKVPDPDHPSKKMKVTVDEDVADYSRYGATIGTLLTTDNLCWVINDSGIQIPGVECK